MPGGPAGDPAVVAFELLEPVRPPPALWQLWRFAGYSLLVALLLAAAAVLVLVAGPVFLQQVVIPLLDWEARVLSRPWQAAVGVLCLALFPAFLVPSTPVMWLLGATFGYAGGFPLIMLGTLAGQTLPFYVGRRFLHTRVQAWLAKRPKEAAVLRLAEAGGWWQQFRFIAILRVSPFPYPLFNYAVTATRIPYSPYIAGSMLGMIPEAFLTLYCGKLLADLTQRSGRKMTPVEIVYECVGLLVAVSVAITATVYGRRALKELEMEKAEERVQMFGGDSHSADEGKTAWQRSGDHLEDALSSKAVAGWLEDEDSFRMAVEVTPSLSTSQDATSPKRMFLEGPTD
eukprot:SM000103S09488  [mRNA]  locus=s103:327445:328709:+ [translate_table: standard]